MSTEPVNTVPYAVAMQEMDEVYEQYENEVLEKYGEGGFEEFTSGLNRETSEFFASERAAQEDRETLIAEEEKENEKNEKARGLKTQMALYDRLVKPLYDSVSSTLKSGGTVSKAKMDNLRRQYDKYKKQADKMEKDFNRIRSEIFDNYREKITPISDYAISQIFSFDDTGRQIVVGAKGYGVSGEVAGGEYTALDGTVYKGKNTYFNEYYDAEDQIFSQINALYEPVADLQKYVDGAFIKEGIGERFEDDFGFSSENWSPAKLSLIHI